MNKVWSDIAWDEYLYWQQTDRKIAKKINELIKDIDRNGLSKQHYYSGNTISIHFFFSRGKDFFAFCLLRIRRTSLKISKAAAFPKKRGEPLFCHIVTGI